VDIAARVPYLLRRWPAEASLPGRGERVRLGAVTSPRTAAPPAREDPLGADLLARDRATLWHPFTQHARWAGDEPLVIAGGEGMHLLDTAGRRYLDGVSSLWVTVHGHRVPEIDDAIRRQLDRLAHSTFLGLTHQPAIELAEALLATAPPGLRRVFYCGDGSSAVEAALKMAFQAAAQRGEHRPLFGHLAEGYHGDTLGAVSVGGIATFHRTYRPILLRGRMVSSPGRRRAGQTPAERAGEVLAELAATLDRHGRELCAVIIEPLVQAAAGILTHDPAFVAGVRRLVDAHGVALIADEVATGIGATGRWWAVDHAGVCPDLLVCGKRLTGGYLPLSAVLAREEVYDAFLDTGLDAGLDARLDTRLDAGLDVVGRAELANPAAGERTFFHGHTYTANPLACAAAVANLRLMVERDTVGHADWVGHELDRLLDPLRSHPGVAEIRRVGAMAGIELQPAGERTGWRVCRRAREHGVLLRPLGDVVVLMPPLAIGAADLAELVEGTVRAVTEVLA